MAIRLKGEKELLVWTVDGDDIRIARLLLSTLLRGFNVTRHGWPGTMHDALAWVKQNPPRPPTDGDIVIEFWHNTDTINVNMRLVGHASVAGLDLRLRIQERGWLVEVRMRNGMFSGYPAACRALMDFIGTPLSLAA